MSYYITTTIKTKNNGEIVEEHKNWAYSQFINILAEVSKDVPILKVTSEDEFGHRWEEDLSNYDFEEFRKEHEASYHIIGSWESWWKNSIQGMKDSLCG